MRAKRVILENFRSYHQRIDIPLSDLTTFIGRNDAGKSTILDALDIFFEGGVVKIEKADANVSGDNRNVRIGVVFDDIPEDLILDSNATTTLQNEYLLNAAGELEIHKVFNCSLAAPKSSVVAIAEHPSTEPVVGILQKTQTELRRLVRDGELQNNCNQGENPSMRHALYSAQAELQLAPQEVPLNDNNAKAVWVALQKYLPLYALFQADRPSSDQDPEVQNPMKVAIDLALSQMEAELEAITEQVRMRASDTANRTLEKLQENYPELASSLTPNFKKPAWKSIFKLDLEADDGIPLNKRGSGVRRLVLMSFFQAEAQKKRGVDSRKVIYAIEEPETSQHPDHLVQIIEVLKTLAESGDQVLFTTHVPGLAELVPLESLRFVDSNQAAPDRVRSGTQDVYTEIANALGILPEPPPSTDLAVAVLVEGKNDIDALKCFAHTLASGGHIQELQEARIFWTIGGGEETLKDWIERSYLDKLKVPQVIIRDSDRSAAAMPLSTEKAEWLARMEQDKSKRCFITKKRNMENYLHPTAVLRLTEELVDLTNGVDIDFVRMDKEFGDRLSVAIRDHGLAFQPIDVMGKPIRARKENAKKIINAYVMSNMTSEEILERSQYMVGEKAHCEVTEWLRAISEFC